MLLLSVGRFEIRRLPELPLPHPIDLLAAAQSIPPPQRHFFVAFTAEDVSFEKIPVGRFGTLTEIQALARWCSQHPAAAEITLISDAFHLPRVRLCSRALLPRMVRARFLPVPDSLPAAGIEPWHPPLALRLRELLKLPLYLVLLAFLRLQSAPSQGR
ncbi:MAG TPA: hypothetical protein VJP87_03550 [Candidatus Acidoferrales bacterium]|nr:hypothetical protein [Candidatus Acidoferrales bacterium]